MNTILERTEYTQNIKKSIFTCTLIPVKSVDEVNTELKLIKKNTTMLPIIVIVIS